MKSEKNLVYHNVRVMLEISLCLTKRCSSLQTAYSSLQTAYSSLQTAYSSLQTAYSSLQTAYSSLQTAYSSLQTAYSLRVLMTQNNFIQTQKNSSIPSNYNFDRWLTFRLRSKSVNLLWSVYSICLI